MPEPWSCATGCATSSDEADGRREQPPARTARRMAAGHRCGNSSGKAEEVGESRAVATARDFESRLIEMMQLGVAELWLEERLREMPEGLPPAVLPAVGAFTDRFLVWVRQVHPIEWTTHCQSLVRGWVSRLVIAALDAEVAAGRLVETVASDGRTYYHRGGPATPGGGPR